MERSLRLRSAALSLGAAFCSAAYLFPYKRAATLAPADVLAFALLVIAAVLSTLSWLLERRGTAAGPRPEAGVQIRNALVLAVLTITGNYCGAQAVARLDPAINSVLLRMEVVFVGVLGALLLGETISGALALGALTALFGLVVMHWPLSVSSLAGAAWCLGAAASFGLMQVVTRRVIHRISPTGVNALRLWTAVALLACVPRLVARAAATDTSFWLCVAAAALFGPFGGRLLIMYSLRGLRAFESALLLLLAPVFAFLLSYLAWGALPSAAQALGSAFMLAGIALPLLFPGAGRTPAQ